MTSMDLLRDIIEAGHRENHDDHARIEARLQAMEDQVVSIRLWRAKVLGISAAISCVLSAAGVLVGHFIALVGN
jgi:hypothetical protein